MKILFQWRLSFFLVLLLFLGASSKNICYLKDRLFLQQLDDIYLNPKEYKDKIIQIEGFFESYIDENEVKRYVVFRKTAGCCGDDGSAAGFEFVYKKGKVNFKNEEWILVEGVIKERGKGEIYLEATSVTPKKQGDKKSVF